MAKLRVYDANGDLTLPQEGVADSDIRPQIRQLPREGVELYVEPDNLRVVAYVKARTSLVDYGNRSAYYHVEYIAESMETLYSGLRNELDALAGDAEKTGDEMGSTSGDVGEQSDAGGGWRWKELIKNRSLPAPENSSQTEEATDTAQSRMGDWEFDRDEKHCEYPWKLPDVESNLPETDALLLDTFKSLLHDKERLTLGMRDHNHALKAIKLFTEEVGCKAAVSMYGRTDALEDVPLVLQPGDFQNFEPIDEKTRDLVQHRRETLVSQLYERYEDRIRTGVNDIVQDPELSYQEKYSTLERAGEIFNGLQRHARVRSAERLSELTSLADWISQSDHLTAEERADLYRFARETVEENQQYILDQAISEVTDEIILQINDRVENLNESYTLEDGVTVAQILRRVDEQLGQDSGSSIQQQTVVGRRLYPRRPNYVVPLPVVAGLVILFVVVIFSTLLWAIWPVSPSNIGIDAIPFRRLLRATIPAW